MRDSRTPRRALPVLAAGLVALHGCGKSELGTGPDVASNDPPNIRLFAADQADVVHGTWTRIQWKIDGATSASITPYIGSLQALQVGSKSIQPVQDVTYTLTASNANGSVTAQAAITVTFRPGIYVDPLGGDDANTGAGPSEPLATLAEALLRTQGGGTLFLSAGDYHTPLVIDGVRHLVYGGLDPATFLPREGYETWIRPPSGTPLTVRASGQTSQMDHVNFDVRTSGGEYVVNVEDAHLTLQDCLLAGSWTASGTALRAVGASQLTVNRCRIRGGGDLPGSPSRDETRGILVDGSTSLAMRHSFVSGGVGRIRSSGVDVHTGGSVTVGLCTISAGLVNSPSTQDAACVRIRQGHPALGGNVLFTRGYGKRPAVIEEAPDADPSWFEGNLLVSVSQPAYDNDMADGADATNEAELNSFQIIMGDGGAGHVAENRLETIPPATLLKDPLRTDYHLLRPPGSPNPAVDSLPRSFGGVRYGLEVRPVDIDGALRPSSYALYDRGADEL